MSNSAPNRDHALTLSVRSTRSLTRTTRREIVDLCTRAFDQDFSNLFAYIDGGLDPGHVLAYLSERLVGHASWSTRRLHPDGCGALRTAYVDAVATDPELWGQGIGSAVLQRLAEETAGYQLRALSTGRVSFYQRLGWELWRGPTAVRAEDKQLVPTPSDTMMIRRTPLTPPLELDGLIVADWRGGQPW